MLKAKVSSKGQAVLPRDVRRHLKIKPGDSIGFTIGRGGEVTLRKIDPMDAAFLKLATESFNDWNDPEAERAFRDL
jgi:AbrB family looped-hinge helix DNA binding protein